MPLDAARANSMTGAINEAFAAIGVTGDTPRRGRATRAIGWSGNAFRVVLALVSQPAHHLQAPEASIGANPIKRPSGQA